ncbi:MAG: hypothetical protein WDO72_01225 [Pseudomonadota bacterium]
MIGRRIAALLCVLLGHAVVLFLLFSLGLDSTSRRQGANFVSEPITMYLDPLEDPDEPRAGPPAAEPDRRVPSQPPAAPPKAAGGESNAITAPSSPDHVDWPLEGQKSVTRLLAREAEAERIARMFAGPGGTWASLTKRQRSKLSKFKWKPGVDGLEYDEKGNAIYRLPNGCAIVNAMFFACQIGKDKVNGNMFDNMREYFDEQRRPQTDEGNGTEPEALRPPN